MARKKQSSKKPRRDIYQEITSRILEILDRGVVPWRNPIRRQEARGWPSNLLSKKPYRGINVFLLTMTAWERGYDADEWLTFNQAKQLGGNVKKGENSSLVTFWKLYNTEDDEKKEEITIPVLRHYQVLNREQCEGLPAKPIEEEKEVQPFEPLDACEVIVDGYKGNPPIEHRSGQARYQPSLDQVLIPEPSKFDTRENYYAVLFHELVHSSGHESRLNRGFSNDPAPFGSYDYGKEELVAEMGAAFLSAAGGISPPTIEQSASYIDNWQKKIRAEKHLVVSAAGAAQKAADHILGKTFDEPS